MPVHRVLVDLGSAPLSNAYLTPATLKAPEAWYPLRVLVCESCWLVQTEDTDDPRQPFDAEYAYFSGFSESWLAHAERYVHDMIERFNLGSASHVVEIAANDGYLLQYVQLRGIRSTGVEPTASTAAAARAKGLTIIEEFFGRELAARMVSEHGRADLVAANNVLAHVPDINDFVAGFPAILKTDGVATFEFPHLLRLIAERQFDTIYYEHFSYLSLTAVDGIFAAHGLHVFDVEEHPTHGGSLRVFAQRSDTRSRARATRVGELMERERKAGMTDPAFYSSFQAMADQIKNEFLSFLLEAKRNAKRVVAYGAAAKGNTLMNYAGVRPDLIEFVVDRNPAKQGKFMPGSRIPIVAEERLREVRPDYVVVLPWNLRTEVTRQLRYIAEWGGQIVTAVPELRVGE
jgi:SAM-dependent methyltransferase